jgi:hypothetical protein
MSKPEIISEGPGDEPGTRKIVISIDRETLDALAKKYLLQWGATFETKEDPRGVTKSGWWQWASFLSSNHAEAWEILFDDRIERGLEEPDRRH